MREETTMKRESQKNGKETLSEFYNDLFFFSDHYQQSFKL